MFAGHIEHSDVIARIKKSGRYGKSGQKVQNGPGGHHRGNHLKAWEIFQVQEREMRDRLGIEAVRYDWERGRSACRKYPRPRLTQNLKDRQDFEVDKGLEREVYDRSARLGWACGNGCGTKGCRHSRSISLQQQAPGRGFRLCRLWSAAKAMTAGVGCMLGEGDVITAGLVGALLSANPCVTFSEMFCPDWKTVAYL